MVEERVIRIAHESGAEINNSELELVSRELQERTKILENIELEIAELESQLLRLNEKKALRRGDAQVVGALAGFQARVKAQIDVARQKRRLMLEDVLRAEERKLLLVEDAS